MFKLYLIITLTITIYLISEFLLLYFVLQKIPVRILINGTRGKTTTVKILHRLLNQAGWVTVSKTTGDQPQFHYPDGTSRTLRRVGPANIKENIRHIVYTLRFKPQVMLLECMALHPELQYILSHKIFNPTHVALTNIKKDHLEVMGTHRLDIVKSIAQSLTPIAQKIIPEELKVDFNSKNPQNNKTQFYKKKPYSKNFSNIPPQIIQHNWGLIQLVSENLRINSELSSSMFTQEWSTINESMRIIVPHLEFELIDLFSVNDPETALQFIKHQRLIKSVERAEIFLLNTRTDRPLRSLEFLKILKYKFKTNEIWVTGGGRKFIKNQFNHNENKGQLVLFLRISQILERIKQGFSKPTRIYGLANHKGMEFFLEQLRHIS